MFFPSLFVSGLIFRFYHSSQTGRVITLVRNLIIIFAIFLFIRV
jgi:hypothetical protein